MAVKISEIKYKNFGRCIRIENAFVEVIVTIDVGPRIIRYSIKGGDNFFYEDKQRKTKHESKTLSDYYGKGACWYLYGGHRVWCAPEYMPETYFPDNARVVYNLIGGRTVCFTPPPQRQNGIQVALEVTLDEYSCDVTVKNRIKNICDHQKTVSVWAVSSLAPGGIEIVPLNNHSSGLLPNKVFSVWPYCNLSDKRIAFSNDLMMLKQEKKVSSNFKIGCDNRRGFSAYILKDAMFVKRFDYIDGAVYPDGGVNYETFVSSNMLEMESLSPLVSVAPGETVTHVEKWDIIDDVRMMRLGDFSSADTLIRKYIEKQTIL